MVSYSSSGWIGLVRKPFIPAARQISNTSTMVSGSENWETYDDNSEPEADATDLPPVTLDPAESMDLDQAMRDGYSTYKGLGLGMPGARRLMDEFEVVTKPGRGTTVTMTKWHTGGRP